MNTTYKTYSAYNELSPQAKKIVDRCHQATLVSPLERCRIILENAKGDQYFYACEAERYLIYES